MALGFSTTLGIIHDGSGKLVPLDAKEMSVYDRLRSHGKESYARFLGFREDLARGRPHDWRCRAGGRYLYIREDGKVPSARSRGDIPGSPGRVHPRGSQTGVRQAQTCARYCTIACVQTVGLFDNWRSPQRGEPYVSRRPTDIASPAPARLDSSLEPQPTQIAR